VQLRDALLETDSEVTVEIVKDDKNTMDMGATIVLILGTPAAIAISKGIADYIRRAGVTVTVSSDEKEVTIKNMKSEDVANSLKAIFSKK
jgi:nitrogen regulatory protein PII-like uncharacterized protein